MQGSKHANGVISSHTVQNWHCFCFTPWPQFTSEFCITPQATQALYYRHRRPLSVVSTYCSKTNTWYMEMFAQSRFPVTDSVMNTARQITRNEESSLHYSVSVCHFKIVQIRQCSLKCSDPI